MKIEHIAMNVREPAALAQWYAANLGLRIIRADTSGTFIHFLADDDGETLLEFYANDSGEYPQLGHWSFHIAFNSDDLVASRDQLVAAGGTSVSDIITLGNGDQTTFVRDPWGIHVQLIRRIKPLEV